MPQHRSTDHSPRRHPGAIAVALALVAAAPPPAVALGFGSSRLRSTLGQPLEFDVQMAVDLAGAPPGCVSAEVYAGDSRVLPASVHADVTADAGDALHPTLRVRTGERIDEPVVAVVVGAGCSARVTRRYTVFVDPAPATSVLEPVSAVALAGPAADAGHASTPEGGRTPLPVDTDGRAASAPARAAASRRRQVTNEGHGRVVAQRAAARHSATGLRDDAQMAMGTPVRAAASPLERGARLHGARLMLDDEPDMAALTASTAASTATGTATAPPAPVDLALRLDALESALKAARAEAAADRRALAAMRVQAMATPGPSASPAHGAAWLWPIVSAALAGALAWSVWRQRRRRHAAGDWRTASPFPDAADAAAGIDAAAAPVTAMPAATPQPGPAAATTPAGPVAATLPPPARDAGGSAPSAFAPAASDHAVEPVVPAEPVVQGLTVEALIDLEQQVDFFIAIGQDPAAIALLQAQLAGEGSAHPMPYLKLLDTYRRLGRGTEYAALRTDVCRRFNVDVAAWPPASATTGRPIEAYAGVVEALVAAWPAPQNAVSLLGRWMAVDGATDDERFDMPAFDDIVFLHALARDLAAREQRPVALSTSFDLPAPPMPDGAASRPLPMPLPEAWAPLDLDMAVCDIELELQGEPRRGIDSRFVGFVHDAR